MEKEIDIEKIVGDLDFVGNQFQCIGNGLFLTNHEIEVLDSYQIDYKNCKSLKEILYYVEELLQDMDIVDEELDAVSGSIAERDYYQNTNW